MIKKGTLLIILLCTYFLLSAKNNFSLQGKILDSNQKPVEFATVALLNASDSKTVSVAVTNEKGEYVLQSIPEGNYIIKASCLGFEPIEKQVSLKETKTLEPITMNTSQVSLKETVVKTTKSPIVKTAEKMVVNVSEMEVGKTGSLEDLLRNMPGVTVDQNGSVGLAGKPNVTILIDGKPSVLAETNMQAFLKSIGANSVDAIELVNNPGAKYDAAGNGGVINIKIKKGKNEGLNGNASIGYGTIDRAHGDFLINYKKGKINVFGGLNNAYFRNGHHYDEDRRITYDGITNNYRSRNTGWDRNLTNVIKAGVDYTIDDLNSISYTFTSNISGSKNNGFTIASYRNAENVRQYTLTTETKDRGLDQNYTNDITYHKKFDSTSRDLMVSLTHTFLKTNTTTSIKTVAQNVLGEIDANQSIDRIQKPANNINNIIAMLDYVEPLSIKGHQLGTGIKNETTINRNEYDVYNKVNGNEVKDSLLSNSFNYLENIAAFYLTYSGAIPKEWFSWNLGMRAEHTFIKSNFSKVGRNYLSWFPSASLTFAWSQMSYVTIGYNRRIQRPAFQQINNAIYYFDPYSTWQGNPYLRPAFFHNVSLDFFSMIKNKHMISITPYATFSKDEYSESTYSDSTRVSRGSVINGSEGRQYGISVYGKFIVTKWWEWQMNHSYAYQYYAFQEGVNNGPQQGHFYNLWMDFSFKFWKNTKLSVNGWFNTGGTFFQGNSKPVGSLNVSLKKSFFNDKLDVILVGNNISNSMKFQWDINTVNMYSTGSWMVLNAHAYLTLTYRFGSDKNTPERKVKESNERLQGGGRG